MIDLLIIFFLVKFVSFISESDGAEQKPNQKHGLNNLLFVILRD